MELTIDGKKIKILESDNNIIDLAGRAKIGIPSPCHRNNRIKGCCNACVIEIDGSKKIACATKPEDGMNIIVSGNDLKEIRKKKLLEYKEGDVSDNQCCSSFSDDDSCC